MSVKILGVPELLKRIDRYPKKYRQQARTVLEDIADRIETSAQDNAPDRRANMEVSIAQNIGKYSENAGMTWRIEVGSQAIPFAAYIEFGTGQDYKKSVEPNLPPEWRAIAFQFFVNGKGTLKHTPFLYPAYVQHSPSLLKELKLITRRIKL